MVLYNGFPFPPCQESGPVIHCLATCDPVAKYVCVMDSPEGVLVAQHLGPYLLLLIFSIYFC